MRGSGIKFLIGNYAMLGKKEPLMKLHYIKYVSIKLTSTKVKQIGYQKVKPRGVP